MALDPKEISARSQKSAYAETGDMTSICMPCTGPVKIEACYDDPWRTPITGAPVRIEDSSGVLLPGVPAGPTTLSLINFGAQDGMDVVLSIRPELGTFFYPQAQRGAIDIALVGDPTAQSEVDALALQINALVAGLKSEMEVALLPWIEEWNDKGIFSIPKAYRNGQLRGLSEWMQEEAGFWASVGNWSLNAFKKAVHLAYQLGVNYYEWYSSLPLIGQIFPLPYWMGEQIVGLMESAYDLWTRRKQIMLLVKGFVNGSVEAIENALKALVDLPGEIGEIITDLVDKSAEWMGATIEMIRETDVLENLTATVFAIVMMMTPNLWAEAIGTVEGYLLPEVLLAIIFTIIAALTAGAGSTLLTARLIAFVAKIKVVLAKAGKIGPLLLKIFASLDEIVKSLIQLVRALKRKINEIKKGTTDVKVVITRASTKNKWIEIYKASKPNELNKNRIKELGVNHEQGGKFDLAEGIGGGRYESAKGRTLTRSDVEGVDFYDGKIPISLKGPLVNKSTGEVINITEKSLDGMANSVIKDMKYNTASSDIIVDTYGMSQKQRKLLIEKIDSGLKNNPGKEKRIIILE